MYLSINQHDQLRTIVMNFEVPYRSYVASKLLAHNPDAVSFSGSIASKTPYPLSSTEYQTFNIELGKIKGQPLAIHSLFVNADKARNDKIIAVEIKVPVVAQVNVIALAFKELYQPIFFRFKDETTFWKQAEKYRYVRNKLDHPGCKTLEKSDMDIALDFISNICTYLQSVDETYFWQKNSSQILKEIIALQTCQISIPLLNHNIDDMPFPDMKIVCRDAEILEIEEFVYGLPGALRKKGSLCLFGYGGVGKTVLVLEAIKCIIRDLQDKTTINGYSPEFILFLTAKEEYLDISMTTGKVQRLPTKQTFCSAEQLFKSIFNHLKIESFAGFTKPGLIIIDNFDTLSEGERAKVQEFVQYRTPQQIQYIITSRNEEGFEERKKIAGFEDAAAGQRFISEYIEENNLRVNLSDADLKTLLQISQGSTSVLVLSLRRLSYNLDTIHGIAADISSPISVPKIKQEMARLPANGYSIISEFMFKNTFTEIENIFKAEATLIYTILKIFAVYPYDSVDIYTICTLSKESYLNVEPIITILCRYLVIEKKGDLYSLNQFAEKYIIQRFMPDAESYTQMSLEIESSTRTIQSELTNLQRNIDASQSLRRIMQDWNIIANGDRIAAAKAFNLYRSVSEDCKRGSRFHIESALHEFIGEIERIEQNTMHPYIKYQKARILQLINDTKVLSDDLTESILSAFSDTIWVIKTNSLYDNVKLTKSFASVLWLFGTKLHETNIISNVYSAVKYLEEGKNLFEQLGELDNEYYQCLTRLGYAYLALYKYDREQNISYLRRSRSVSNDLFYQRGNYSGAVKAYATSLRDELQTYGRF